MAFQVQVDRPTPSLLNQVAEIAHINPSKNMEDLGQAEQIKILAKLCLELNIWCATLEKSLRALGDKAALR
jgi:hypothetical protein